MIRIAIVEDDRMVASINAQFAARTAGVRVEAAFHCGRAALEWLEGHGADLLLLDLYLPDMSGLELLARLRQQKNEMDVIMITAANDGPSIREALRLGIVDYLIKPFRYERFSEAMELFIRRRAVTQAGQELTQRDIDRLISGGRSLGREELEKGIQKQTLERILDCLDQRPAEFLTGKEIAAQTGLSKVTVLRYMNYLIEGSQAESQVDYSTGGRPCIRYRRRR